MVKFLIKRPIAVLMAFTACFIVGLVTYFSLPVSLLPDVDIPQINRTGQRGKTQSARELENTDGGTGQTAAYAGSGLTEMKSETRDGSGIIRLSFDFGTNTDLAFIEVNEKIDAAMNGLPKDAVRPKAIKASATDIPVFYLNMTLKNDLPYRQTNEDAFLNMCTLAENVVKRRIEQLPQVAMADMTGVPQKMLRIVPDMGKMEVWEWGSLIWRIYSLQIMWSRGVCLSATVIMNITYALHLFSVRRKTLRIYISTAMGLLCSSRIICHITRLVTRNEPGRSLD